VTINGIGERAGNAALEEVVMALHVRKQYYNPMLGRDAMDQNALTNINMKEIYRSSKLVTSMTGMFVQVSPSLSRARARALSLSQEAGEVDDRDVCVVCAVRSCTSVWTNA
jgi:2-isopropylmalate synthase